MSKFDIEVEVDLGISFSIFNHRYVAGAVLLNKMQNHCSLYLHSTENIDMGITCR